MNKNELVRWLKSEKERAVAAHSAAYNTAKDKMKAVMIEQYGAKETFQQMNNLAMRYNKVLADFNKKAEDHVRIPAYYSIQLRGSEDLRYEDKTYNAFCNAYGADKRAIERNYDNIIEQVKKLTADRAIAWLTELGFIVPAAVPKKEPTNEIVAVIDKNYLLLDYTRAAVMSEED